MNKIESLQEKYNSKKNDMSKEELLEFNECLFKSFLSDKKANDDVFWAYSEITDRVIEDLEEKNALLINVRRLENKGDRGYNDKLELEIELNRVAEDNGRLKKEVSFFKQLSFANGLKFNDAKKDIAKLESDLVKEQSDIVIDEVIEQLDKEIMYYNIFQPRTARELIHLKNKIKEMGNK